MSENKINYHRLLEWLSSEGLEDKIINYAIWKLACKYMRASNPYLNPYLNIMEFLKKELKKWRITDGT